MILLVYSLDIEGSTEVTDHWVTCDSMAEAERQYAVLLELPNLYVANICRVLKSTDYDVEEITA
jgi:hypothetical protein